MGGGERAMSGPSAQCICSAAASAVDPHGWMPGYRHVQRDKHTLTYTLSVLWIRYSSVDPPRKTSLSSSFCFLFQYEEKKKNLVALHSAAVCALAYERRSER